MGEEINLTFEGAKCTSILSGTVLAWNQTKINCYDNLNWTCAFWIAGSISGTFQFFGNNKACFLIYNKIMLQTIIKLGQTIRFQTLAGDVFIDLERGGGPMESLNINNEINLDKDNGSVASLDVNNKINKKIVDATIVDINKVIEEGSINDKYWYPFGGFGFQFSNLMNKRRVENLDNKWIKGFLMHDCYVGDWIYQGVSYGILVARTTENINDTPAGENLWTLYDTS